MILGANIMFLNFLFLPLTIKALEIIECDTRQDGTTYLVAEPSLSCDDPWHKTWSTVGWILIFLYSAGLLLFYTLIFFKFRPRHETLPLFGFPKGSWRETLFELYIPRSSWIVRGRWVEELHQKRYEVDGVDEPTKILGMQKAIQLYNSTYKSLLKNYHTSVYWYALVPTTRLLALGIIAIRMGRFPLYQVTLAMIVISGSLLLQMRWRPFRSVTEHTVTTAVVDGKTFTTKIRTHSFLNELAMISLTTSLIIRQCHLGTQRVAACLDSGACR